MVYLAFSDGQSDPSNFVSKFLCDLPERFQPLHALLESKLEPYIKIRATAAQENLPALWQSKIGGEPYLPQGYEYPRDRFTGEIMPLLIQINCADVPKLPGFDFPNQGILQIYLGYCAAQSELSPERCRVLYFPEFSENEDDLITDFNFIDYSDTLQEYMDAPIYALEFAAERILFQTSLFGEDFEVPEDLTDLYEEFKDEYDIPEIGDKLGSLLGSYDVDTEYVIADVQGRVFLELRETLPNGEYFLFFINDEDLKCRDFSNVEVRMVFY